MNWRLGARTLGKKALMSTLYPLLRPLVEAVIDSDTRNIERWRYRQSLAETGCFVEEHLPSIQSLRDPAALLRLAVEHLEEEAGLDCEFGVYTGTSLNQSPGNTEVTYHLRRTIALIGRVVLSIPLQDPRIFFAKVQGFHELRGCQDPQRLLVIDIHTFRGATVISVATETVE